jgi:hypothetical protein
VQAVKSIGQQLLLCILLLTGCAPTVEEVSRVGTQDRLVDAVVCIRQTDATVSTPTEIYLLPAGEKPSGDPVFRADKVVGLVATWTSNNSLQIEAKEARVFVKRDVAEIAINGLPEKRRITVAYKIERSL